MPAARISFSLELNSATTYFSTSAGVIGIGGSRVIGPHWVVQVYVSSRPASVLAWPATPVDVAQPATRLMQVRTPRGLVACRTMRAA